MSSPEGKPPAGGRGSEHTFASTTFAWRRVKIAPPPEARGDRRPKGGRWWSLPPWPVRKPLHLTVKYRGGAECWIEVHARGRIGRFPGHTALVDCLREIWREDRPS